MSLYRFRQLVQIKNEKTIDDFTDYRHLKVALEIKINQPNTKISRQLDFRFLILNEKED